MCDFGVNSFWWQVDHLNLYAHWLFQYPSMRWNQWLSYIDTNFSTLVWQHAYILVVVRQCDGVSHTRVVHLLDSSAEITLLSCPQLIYLP